MSATIPANYLHDRYWKGLIYMFQNHCKLNLLFTTKYFDFESGTVKVQALKRAAAPWSQSEKFLLYLALHMFNESSKVNLSDIDYLDDYNKELVFKALKLRYS